MIFARESLLLGIAVMLPVLWYVFRRERFGSFWSISLHASAHRETTVVFGAGLLAASFLLAVYFQDWLTPKYSYGWPMRAVLWAAVGSLVLLALIPHYEGRWQGRVHVIISWAMVLLMPLGLLFHALATPGSFGSIIVISGIILQLCLLSIFYGVEGMHEKFASMQSLFIAIYFLCIVTLGYM